MLELINRAKNGDKDAIEKLLTDNKKLVNIVVRKYFLVGGDVDDLVQEGMIALYNAILSFDESKNSSFNAYALTVIERHIISTIKQFNNKKNMPLNEAININNQGSINKDNDEDKILFTLVSSKPNPENELVDNDSYNELLKIIEDTLSEYENKVLKLYLLGYNYQDIAVKLNVAPKSIDNALNRIKNKLNFLKDKE